MLNQADFKCAQISWGRLSWSDNSFQQTFLPPHSYSTVLPPRGLLTGSAGLRAPAPPKQRVAASVAAGGSLADASTVLAGRLESGECGSASPAGELSALQDRSSGPGCQRGAGQWLEAQRYIHLKAPQGSKWG